MAMTDSMVAVVNDRVITSRDLAGQVALAQRQFAQPIAAQDKLIRQIFGEVIEGEIKRQYALSRNITVTDAEIDAAAKNLAKSNNIDSARLQKMTQGLEPVFKEKLATQILWDKVVQNELVPQVNISTAETDRIIRDILSGEVVSEREISQIFLPTSDPKAETTIKAAALEIKEKKDFAIVAQKFGTGASAKKGGYLGWFAEGALNPDLEEALKTLKVGDISAPLETDAGWHIVKIHRVKKAPAITFDPIEKVRLYEVSVAVSSTISLKKALGKNKFLGDLQKNDKVTITDKQWQPVNNLNKSVQAALPRKTGLSKVITTSAGERAFYVSNRKREMANNLLRLRAKVDRQLGGNKARQLERKFLRDLKSRAFIELAPDVIKRVKAAS